MKSKTVCPMLLQCATSADGLSLVQQWIPRSLHNTVSAAFSSKGEDSSCSSPTLGWWDRVLPTADSPPLTCTIWVFPMGCSSSGTGPAGVTSPACKLAPEWTPLSRSCQGPPAWASHRLTVSSRHPPAPGWGSPWAAEELPDTSSMTGAEVKLFSNTWGTSVSFFTDLGACTALTRSHSSLWLALLLCTKLFPFLTVLCRGHYHNTSGVSLRQSAMELGGTDSVDMGEASRIFL